MVEAAKRESREGDPLNDSTEYLSQAELRDTSPFEPDHPRPYEVLLDTSTQPEGWPNNLVQTLFSLESWDVTDPLAVGINTYALYINFSSRDNGPQYEAWDYGTFTGELFVGTDLVLFENYIDIDGDSVDDVSISLTVLGLFTLNEGFGFEPPLNPLNPLSIPDTLWLRPTFQWKIDYLNENDPIWDELFSHGSITSEGACIQFSNTGLPVLCVGLGHAVNPAAQQFQSGGRHPRIPLQYLKHNW